MVHARHFVEVRIDGTVAWIARIAKPDEAEPVIQAL